LGKNWPAIQPLFYKGNEIVIYNKVHHPGLYYEHEDLANNSVLQNQGSIVWSDIKDELLKLEQEIALSDKNTLDSDLPP
jgi:hypothetical protein